MAVAVWEVGRMVETKPKIELGACDRYYHPANVARWLDDWDALTAMAERVGAISLRPTPASTRHLFTDAHQWASVKADLLSAWNMLGPGSSEFRLIYLVLFGKRECERWHFGEGEQGDRKWRAYLVTSAGDLLGLLPGLAIQVYWRAVRRMSRHLGWVPADERGLDTSCYANS